MTRGLAFFLPLAVLLLATTASAKSANAYFHGAASQYVAGKIQEAALEVGEGLRRYPDDARLRALGEQLGKMKDQQRGNSGKDDKKGDKKENGKDKNPDDRNKPDGSKNPSDQDRKNKQGKNGDQKGEKDKRDEKKDADKPQPKPGEDPQDKGGKKDDGKNAAGPGKMSEDEAKRLLNSFADDEKKEQAERRRVLRQRAGTEQDW
jgi:hypothetical protein